MSGTRILRVISALTLFVVFAAACGQKANVHLAGSSVPGGVAMGRDGQVLASETAVPVDTDGDGQADAFTSTGTTGGTTVAGGTDTSGAAAGTSTATTSSGSTSGAQTSSGSGSGGGGETGDTSSSSDTSGKKSGSSPPTGTTSGGDSTGITADTITIGVHAPLTGAAPIPQRSFYEGKDQYWNEVGKIYGRKINVVFRDDKYNPSAASQVCQELILQEKVFMLAGSGGTDQIAECARVAAHYGVPYLSAGVTRVRLDKLPNYFAQSKSYADQMPLLMQWIRKNRAPQNKIVGIIASNTANFDDAVAAFEAEAKKAGYIPKTYRPSKAPSDGELAGIASNMVRDGVTVATPVMQPTAWIKMAKNAQLQEVDWAGIGVTMGLNSVATAVCPSANGAMFFSPFPGFNLATQLDPRAEVAKDDIQWAQWGSNKALHEIFKRMNGVLTREAFVKALIGPVETGIFPSTSHTQDDHFRVDSVHVLHLDCSKGKGEFISSKSDLFRKGF